MLSQLPARVFTRSAGTCQPALAGEIRGCKSDTESGFCFSAAEPFIETVAAETRFAQRNLRTRLGGTAEESGLGVAHDVARVIDCLQIAGDDFVEGRSTGASIRRVTESSKFSLVMIAFLGISPDRGRRAGRRAGRDGRRRRSGQMTDAPADGPDRPSGRCDLRRSAVPSRHRTAMARRLRRPA